MKRKKKLPSAQSFCHKHMKAAYSLIGKCKAIFTILDIEKKDKECFE